MKRYILGVMLISVSTIISFFLGYNYYYFSMYAPITSAIAVIHPTQGHTTNGTITFTYDQQKKQILIHAQLKDTPKGLHGIHIHEYGKCDCPDALCAGDHFNPYKKNHGGPFDKERHVGDLGNIMIDENGIGTYTYYDPCIMLHGPHSILGRSVIIHNDPDDLISQPTGNAGARIGVGVIGIMK